MEDYEPIRQQLNERHAAIRMRLQKITRDVQHANEPLNADFAEQAVQRENDEVLDALDNSIRAEIKQIETTLQRLEEGTYGVCESCGKRIPLKRLKALPHASRCVACAENVERTHS
ncbi:MAG TPA: TraR/DksA family transcriptional regulator [Blastocatellia bacterium]|nr:TraR/DksA family transcriptional regulator [Blastocatellia bacterium]